MPIFTYIYNHLQLSTLQTTPQVLALKHFCHYIIKCIGSTNYSQVWHLKLQWRVRSVASPGWKWAPDPPPESNILFKGHFWFLKATMEPLQSRDKAPNMHTSLHQWVLRENNNNNWTILHFQFNNFTLKKFEDCACKEKKTRKCLS